MYAVSIDSRVFDEDFRKIDKKGQQQIIKAIRKKLTTRPDLYGKPLRGALKNCWKLKVGPYRVVYEIHRREVKVYVILAGLRRDAEAYLKAAKRLGIF